MEAILAVMNNTLVVVKLRLETEKFRPERDLNS